LFGDAKDGQKITNRDSGIATNKIDCPMMRAPHILFGKNRVGFTGEIAVSEKHQFNAAAQFFFAEKKSLANWFYVSHVDQYRM
jgi:hypothetical protein